MEKLLISIMLNLIWTANTLTTSTTLRLIHETLTRTQSANRQINTFMDNDKINKMIARLPQKLEWGSGFELSEDLEQKTLAIQQRIDTLSLEIDEWLKNENK